MGVKDPELIKSLFDPFKLVSSVLISLPVNFPGTQFSCAAKGGKLIREQLIAIVKQRKKELLLENKDARSYRDLLSRMVLESSNESEMRICSIIMGLLISCYYSLSSAATCTIKSLAQYLHVYEVVLREQMEITKSRGPGELLNWDDIKKMKYSWCVACETMRLLPPGEGAYKEVITDFTYAGFTFPRGLNIHWIVHSTHKNSKYFLDPEKFDPSRFEGNGPMPFVFVPFSGGLRMCLGKEYARLLMLVFMQNVVTNFKLRKVNPDEQIVYDQSPIPTNGLLVHLRSVNT